jgi:hypothetical protein
MALALWLFGSSEQALKKSHDAIALAQAHAYPHTLAFALDLAAVLHQHHREGQAVQERAEALIALSTEQGFVLFLARLWQQQGKHRAAGNMLAEICSWFTQGFDAKDLQEAKARLQELEHN